MYYLYFKDGCKNVVVKRNMLAATLVGWIGGRHHLCGKVVNEMLCLECVLSCC